ncbi:MULTISPECIES: LytTR family DNA-binding domain-containing protein [unclassified Spirosoma]|uniref:LytR/AlgR family response regulator transcription factor n=1 Tax=unclassified Spirosoma TaxID=2621999 RepID=UPI0025CC48C7|nr:MULTISPECIES: LytTR family DNA-binding domain-containing protein [unclassified Spirosoma]
MLQAVTKFMNRPIAEDFSFKTQIWQSIQTGIYVFLFVYFFGGSSFGGSNRVGVLALFGAGCTVSTLFANWLVPTLLSRVYDEERWVVWKYILHTFFVLFCISLGNQLLLVLTQNDYPSFWQMYLIVTLIGFFPIISSVFVSERRRLKRNLAQAQELNRQLTQRAGPLLTDYVPSQQTSAKMAPAVDAKPILLSSENGKERLALQPEQLLYVESVGNYVDVYWLNRNECQKTVLRSTLKEVADALSVYPQFFRCHRAFLVNLKMVNQTEGNARGYQLTLNGVSPKIPVSRTYLDAFDARMNVII